MNENIAEKFRADGVARPNWSAVFAVAFCVACLITVEFLPVSLLTPMAQDLGISEGVAGQSVTVTAFVAMFSSLFITQIIQATDRRYIVILFAVLLTASCLMVSFANSFTLLLLGRACLGLALGGFWAMSASLTMRLVPARTVPKALSVIFGAVSIALVIAAPLGSFLGGIIGWRNVFNAAATGAERADAHCVGKRQNRGGGNSDYLGTGVCAGAGGMVNVDHSFSCRSGGKSRFHPGRGDSTGKYLWRGGGWLCARQFRAAFAAGAFRRTDAVDGVSRGGESPYYANELILLPFVGRIRR